MIFALPPQSVYILRKTSRQGFGQHFDNLNKSDCTSRACRVSQLECEPRSRARVTRKCSIPLSSQKRGVDTTDLLCVSPPPCQGLHPDTLLNTWPAQNFCQIYRICDVIPSGRPPKSQHQSGIKAVEKLGKSLFLPIKKPSNISHKHNRIFPLCPA